MNYPKSPVSLLSVRGRSASARGGFTLVELLMVIAVILILAGITFGISRGVQNAQARTQAKAELALIAQALEQFKSRNGDYPWADDNPGNPTSNGEDLLQALAGFKKFDTSGSNVNFRNKWDSEIPDSGPNSFIDLDKISMNESSSKLPDDPGQMPVGFHFADPWGSPYVYRYKKSNTDKWENFSYVLYSKGPDGLDTPIGTDGIITKALRTDSNNVDNIYAGE